MVNMFFCEIMLVVFAVTASASGAAAIGALALKIRADLTGRHSDNEGKAFLVLGVLGIIALVLATFLALRCHWLSI